MKCQKSWKKEKEEITCFQVYLMVMMEEMRVVSLNDLFMICITWKIDLVKQLSICFLFCWYAIINYNVISM